MNRAKLHDPCSEEGEEAMTPPTLRTGEPHFTAQEFARLLNVTVRTLRRWVRRGYVAALIYGRSIRFSHAEVERVLSLGTHGGRHRRPVGKQ
jgi:excisionase family DNA binding protein